MKKNFLMFLCVIILLVPFLTTASAAADTKSELDMNFVIVMDNSGSLEKADPQKLCVEGAKLFADLLPMKNTKVGFIVFGGSVVYQTELLNVNDVGQKQGLKSTIKKKMDYSQHLTDIGDALEAAIKMLGTENKAKSAILLFTDGDLRVYANDRVASLKQIDDAVATANKNEWPIYTIGLNYKGRADKEMLRYISQTTGAGDPLLATETGQMLPYYTEIFERFMDIDALTIEEVISNGFADFTIMQPEMATEINIVLTGASIGNVALTDPQGNPVDLENKDQVYYTREKKYILLKILQTQPGPWKLHVEGGDGQKIYVQTLNTYDLPLSTDIYEKKNETVKFDPSLVNNVKKNETVIFDSYLVYNDTRSTMPGFYNETAAKVVLVDTETKVKTEYDMQVLEDGYTLSLPMSDGGTFEAQVLVDTPNFKRESNIYTIVVENQPVETVGSMPPVDMKVGTTNTIDLSQYFYDPYGDALDYSFNLNDSELATFSAEQNILTITAPGKAGAADITVTADDGDGSTASQSFSLSVENTPIEIKRDFSSPMTYVGDTVTYDLNDYFYDPDGLPIEYSVSTEGDACTFTADETGILSIKAEKSGATVIHIDATDSAGSSITQEASVTSYSSLFEYYFNLGLPYIIGIIALILLILLIRYLFTKIRGSMKVWIETEDENGENTFTTFTEYMFVPTRLKLGKGKIKGKKFSLSDLLNKYSNYLFKNYEELNFPSTGAFSPVKFKGVVFGYRAKIKLKPGNAPVILGAGNNEQKLPLKIKTGQTMTASVKEENKIIKVSIEYIG